jgi:alanine dehydrogenase
MGTTIGLPRMFVEFGEKRDFLPDFVTHLAKHSARLFLEHGYGSGMNISEGEYSNSSSQVSFTSHEDAYHQDLVIVLRCPNMDDLKLIKPGAVLISMLHYPTRPERTRLIHSMGIEGVSLDSIKDDSGRRLVENLQAVAWNGVEAAFQALQRTYPAPGLYSPSRPPLNVTVLGSGAVGSHVVQSAIRYGNRDLWKKLASQGVPGVRVTVIDHDLTGRVDTMHEVLASTDILVDATQRTDPSQPVILNDWIAWLPNHSVLLDLSVDPYQCETPPFSVKGIEGIPQGNLDQYLFAPDDPAYQLIPECIPTKHQRYCASCYSWPGIHPRECMQVYGDQLKPILRTLLERDGVKNIRPNGRFFERAIYRSLLSRWIAKGNNRFS